MRSARATAVAHPTDAVGKPGLSSGAARRSGPGREGDETATAEGDFRAPPGTTDHDHPPPGGGGRLTLIGPLARDHRRQRAHENLHVGSEGLALDVLEIE